MKNIETKWLYDFLTLEACRNFCQAAKVILPSNSGHAAK